MYTNNNIYDGICKTDAIIYKAEWIVINDQKIYIGCTKGNFRKRWFNHKSSFKQES